MNEVWFSKFFIAFYLNPKQPEFCFDFDD